LIAAAQKGHGLARIASDLSGFFAGLAGARGVARCNRTQ